MISLHLGSSPADIRSIHFQCLKLTISGMSFCSYSTLGQNQGGVVFLRPCAAIAEHMLALAGGDPLLQFRHGHAEQDFFDWCAVSLAFQP